MNTTTPAYLVYHSHPASGPTRRFFTDENLLTARRAASTFVESLFANRVQDYLLQDEAELSLVEITSPDDPAPTFIAQLLHHEPVDYNTDEYRQHKQQLLAELQREYDYYQAHHHSVGFGALSVKLRLEDEPAPARTFVVLVEAASELMVHLHHHNSPWRPHFDFEYHQPDELPAIRQLSE